MQLNEEVVTDEILVHEEKLKVIKQELSDITKELKIATQNHKLKLAEVDGLEKKIKNLKNIFFVKHMFKNISEEKLQYFTEDELVAINKGIDKSDYTKYNVPILFDLDKTLDNIIETKKKYSEWKLDSLSKGGQYDTMPPQNFYKFTYKTQEGWYVTMGGLQVLN